MVSRKLMCVCECSNVNLIVLWNVLACLKNCCSESSEPSQMNDC